MIEAPTLPALSYDEAERVGIRLRRQWKAISGKKKTPRLTPEGWADLVQCVQHHARQEVAGRDQ